MDKKLKILHLEDVSSDAILVNNQLKKSKLYYEILVVDTKDKFITELNKYAPDIILSDHTLPSFNSHEALIILQETSIKIPFILITATMSDEFAADMIKRGADDYIIKDRLNRLPIAIQNALENFRLKQEQQTFVNEIIKNEKRYHALIENSNDVIVIFNLKGNPTYASRSIMGVLGYSEEETMLLDIYKIVHPEDREGLSNTMDECLKKPGVTLDSHVCRIKHKDGSWKWVEATVTNMLHDPAINGIVDNFRDVTEKKLVEEKLENNERKFRGLIENGTDGIVILSAEGNPTYVSQSVSRILGYTEDEAMKLNLFALMHPDDREGTVERMKICLNSPATPLDRITSRVKHKDGSWRWMEATMTNMLHDPAINGIVDNFRDITERKLTEIDLLESREEMQTVFNASLDAIIIIDEEGKITKWDPKAELLFGWKEEEVIGSFLSDNIIPPGLREAHKKGMKHFLKTGEGPFLKKIIEVKALKKDNTEIDISLSISPTRVKNKYQFIGFIRDISERKIAEHKLKITSNDLETAVTGLNKILDSSLDVICTVNSSGEFVTVSAASQQVWGYTPEELIGIKFINLVYHEDVERTVKAAEQIVSGIQVPTFENRYVHKNGTVVPLLWSVNWDEKIKLMFCIAKDVTEKKKADEENKFKANLLNTIGQAAIATDIKGVVTYWNKAAENIYGWTSEEAIGKNIIDITPAQATKELALEIMKHLKKGGAWSGEFKVQKKDGTNFPAMVTNAPLYNENNIFSGIIGISSDITKTKKLEQLLEKSDRLARIGSWEYNVSTNTHFWSPITREIYEVEKDFKLDLQTGITFYKFGESRSNISTAVDKALKDGTPWDLELQIVTVSGKELWVRDIGEAEFMNGKCVKLYGSFQDITSRKNAELETLKAYEEKNIILESIGDAFFAMDKNWTVTYWNKHAEKLSTKKKEEILNHNLLEVFPQLIQTPFYNHYQKALRENSVQHFEAYYPHLEMWSEVSAYPANNGLSVYFKDITKRKISEFQLKTLNDELQKHIQNLAISNKELEDFAYVASHDLQEPLRMVTGFLGQIEKKYSEIIDDKGKQYIHFAIDGAKRMRQIILDLLEFSRIGRTDDSENNIDLNDIVREVILLYQKKIKRNKCDNQLRKFAITFHIQNSFAPGVSKSYK